AAAGDATDNRPACAGDLSALARRRALDAQTDAAAVEPTMQLADGFRRARKVLGREALLGDGEIQRRLDRGDGLVEVVAIKRQAGFEPQRVSGAEADRTRAFVREQTIPKPSAGLAFDQDLEAVLAGVAGSADDDWCAFEAGGGEGHEGQF